MIHVTDTIYFFRSFIFRNISFTILSISLCFRPGEIGMGTWIISNAYLGVSDQDNNAECMYDYLHSIGWSLNAVSAVAGNFARESNLNPGIWQNLDEGNLSGGLGLGQWTPATKLINWADGLGIPWKDGNNQCRFLDENSDQWHETGRPGDVTGKPPITWDEFKKSDLSVSTLTHYFYAYWEDPAYSDDTLPARQEDAEHFYELLSGYDPGPSKKKGMPLYMMLRRF